MMWYGGLGEMWFLGPLVMLAFWVGVAVLAMWAIRSVGRGSRTVDGSFETLRRRLAAGEITEAEYEQTRRVLEGR